MQGARVRDEGVYKGTQLRNERAATQQSVKSASKICGDYSEEDTPVPISNTVVKLLSAEDTLWEAAWENRTLPLF